MKKQLLTLIVAIFAITFTTAYGQVTCPVPRPVDVTCLPNDALHPMAGTPYTYTVDVPTPPGTKAYTWFVTQDVNFITAGVLTANRETNPGLHIAAAGVGYNNPPASNTLSITWKSFVYDAANPVFVVIEVKPTTGCTASNNLKVYKIMPINAFTLDIANIGADKHTVSPYETNIDRCLSKVVGSMYDPADDKVKMDFGADTLYYVVTAANFSTSWKPSLKVNAIDPLETITSVEWFRPTDVTFGTPEAMPLAAGIYTATNPVLVLDPSGTVGSAGECIVIRAIVDHTNGANMYEGLADETVTIAVDGKTQLALATPLGDIHFSSTIGIGSECGQVDGFDNDIATQILKARPAINAVTPTPFLLTKP
jgi:hypothetical protein